ncbi:Membrane steroid-binding protein 2 [Salvia divinorum]|uniref:Membrane steroid-binding protein 2 n=1 Tax=Salvia divinorum TaxID=28513 RepID=A0ABD1FL10_SALDI
MAVQLWEALKESITVYTGLTPAAFFTAIAVAIAFYQLLSALFGSSDDVGHVDHGSSKPEEDVKPLPPPVQLGEVTGDELKQYDGSDSSKPLLMAIKGQIYDVSQSRMFYGPGGPYALFAGKDASRALANMSFDEKDLNGDLTGLGAYELEALQDWEYKFMSKYVKVGTVKAVGAAADESSAVAANGEVAEDGPSAPEEATEIAHESDKKETE